MASDPARQFIDDVNVELDIVTEKSNTFTTGKLDGDEHNSPPIVNWELGSVTHGPAETTNSIGVEFQELIVSIWADGVNDDERDWNTRALKNNLLRACRTVALRAVVPDPIAFGDFAWSEEAHGKLGRRLTGSVELKLNMPAEEPTTVIITTVAKTTKFVDPVDGSEESLGTLTNPAP